MKRRFEVRHNAAMQPRGCLKLGACGCDNIFVSDRLPRQRRDESVKPAPVARDQWTAASIAAVAAAHNVRFKATPPTLRARPEIVFIGGGMVTTLAGFG